MADEDKTDSLGGPPLRNGWHVSTKFAAEEGRFVLLTRDGTFLAEFSSGACAGVVMRALRDGI